MMPAAGPPGPAGFAAAVGALGGPRPGSGVPLALAVSGGPDSLAMLALALPVFGADLHVLTFDHGLRSESAAEAAAVADLARGLGLGVAVLGPAAPLGTANIQAAARAARLAAMGGWCSARGVPFLLTAHHADDQAETLLMRLARGAGLDGLSGIRPARPLAPGVMLLRPLLGWRRADLAAVVAQTGWEAVTDPSNADFRYDRTRARALLGAQPWLRADRLAASAAHLAEARAALEWVADEAWRSRAAVGSDTILVDCSALPAEVQRRLVVRALGMLGAPLPRGDGVGRLLAALSAGRRATLSGVLAVPSASGWRFGLAPPRRTVQHGDKNGS